RRHDRTAASRRWRWRHAFQGHRDPRHVATMNPFQITKQKWEPGDTREVEQDRLRREIGVEYDSYRRIYIADGYEWQVIGQIAKDDGKKYYILECVGAA